MATAATWGRGMVESPKRKPVMPSEMLGMLVFVGAELMFFLGLISAYLVIKAGVNSWTPPENVRLPIEATAFNTLMLFLSGVSLFLAGQSLKSKADGYVKKTAMWYGLALAFGAFFVSYQGYEWVRLVSYGMNMTSGIFGACFFLLIGSHGFHAAAAILVMAWYFPKVRAGRLTSNGMLAMQVFWFFVVGIWPILYGLVYF